MPKTDPFESKVMHDCQRGVPLRQGGTTGCLCRNKPACRDEGRCYFIAQFERHFELHPEDVWVMPKEPGPTLSVVYPPPEVTRCCAAEPGEPCEPGCPRHRLAVEEETMILIQWHPGYDGYRWAI